LRRIVYTLVWLSYLWSIWCNGALHNLCFKCQISWLKYCFRKMDYRWFRRLFFWMNNNNFNEKKGRNPCTWRVYTLIQNTDFLNLNLKTMSVFFIIRLHAFQYFLFTTIRCGKSWSQSFFLIMRTRLWLDFCNLYMKEL
jgi:hypothetical protein